MFGAARRLYRLAREKEKPDAEREPGYQERDLRSFRQRLSRLDRRYHPSVDKALWMHALGGYLAQPAEYRVAAFDEVLGLTTDVDEAAVSSILDHYYAETVLEDAETRLALMDATPRAIEAHDDPFLRLAVAVFDSDMEREEASKTRSGRGNLLRPQYMQAIIDWQRSEGHTTYLDANGTLRVTYGTVLGGSPMDGLIYEPFTRLNGILEKDSGVAPFNAPAKLLERARAEDYGAYRLESIGSVPVNFLSDLDSTGGNSGSPTLNANGELVGLLFRRHLGERRLGLGLQSPHHPHDPCRHPLHAMGDGKDRRRRLAHRRDEGCRIELRGHQDSLCARKTWVWSNAGDGRANRPLGMGLRVALGANPGARVLLCSASRIRQRTAIGLG